MCLVEREEAKGARRGKGRIPAPFISVFTANDVRKEHVLQTIRPTIFAVSTCELRSACRSITRAAAAPNIKSSPLCAALTDILKR